jgi:hypothetical protein
MMEAIQASIVAVVMALGCVSAWAGPKEDYRKGREHEQAEDYAEAVKWYRKAADQGYASAQFNLGFMYNKGKGVPLDDTEAVKWYRKAAEQGDAKAQSNLGFMYQHGEGVTQDYTEAVKWYRKAAEQGQAGAQYNLGFKYRTGEGVPQDYVRAHMWWNLASHTTPDGARWRDEIAKQMTPTQIAEAERRARVCLDSNYKDCD